MLKPVTALLGTALVFLTGCAAPHVELGSYKRSFEASRQITEEYLLAGRHAAKEHADDPHNTDSAEDRVRKLRETMDSFDARLEALNAVTAYNDTLVGLISGSDDQEIQANLNSFTGSVIRLLPSLGKFAGPAAPAVSTVSVLAAKIQDAVRLKKFKNAIRDAQEILPAIFEILKHDVQSLAAVQEAGLLREQSAATVRITKATLRARNILNAYQAGPDDRFATLVAIRTRAGLQSPEPMFSHRPVAEAPAWPPDPKLNAQVEQLIDEANDAAAEWERVREQIMRTRELSRAYAEQMNATQAAFQTLAETAENPKVSWLSAAEITTIAVRNFKEAKLALQQVQ